MNEVYEGRFYGDGVEQPTNWCIGPQIALGRLTSVNVVLDTDQRQLKKYAVKRAVISDDTHASSLKEIDIEIKSLRKLKHVRILKYYGYSRTEKMLSLFVSYLEKGSLAKLLKDGPISEQKAAMFTCQILEGLEYLHKEKIIHRDIKGSNILMQDDSNIKISDFGVAKILNTLSCAYTQGTGTRYWMAPEVWRDDSYNNKIDIWSLGCTVYQMVTGKIPFLELTEIQIMRKSLDKTLTLSVPENCSSVLHDFVQQACEKEPTRRPSATLLLTHQFTTVFEKKETDDGRLSLLFGYRKTADYMRKEDNRKLKTISDNSDQTDTLETYNLLQASRTGDVNRVKFLIQFGSDINQVNEKGWDSLMFAANNGREDVLVVLLKAGSDVSRVNNDKCDALMLASIQGHIQCVVLLLKYGSNIHRINTDDYNALMLASGNGQYGVVKILLKHDSNVNQINKQEMNALMLASSSGYYNVVEILLKYRSDVMQVSADGMNALMLASSSGYYNVVEILLKNGSIINQINKKEMNALMLASSSGHFNVVEILLNYGSDVMQVNTDGMNALMLVIANGKYKIAPSLKSRKYISQVNYDEYEKLINSSIIEHKKIIKILIEAGCDVNQVNNEECDALMLASSRGHYEVVELLIKAGCDVSRVNMDLCDALMLASSRGHFEVVELLIKAGCDVSRVNIDLCDALMLASKWGFNKIVDILLLHGSNLKQLDSKGRDALMLAAGQGHVHIVNCLLEAGMDFSRVDKNGWDCLMFAARYGHDAVAEILLQHITLISELDISNQTNQGKIDLCILNTKLYIMEVSFIAFENGHSCVIKMCHTAFQEIYHKLNLSINNSVVSILFENMYAILENTSESAVLNLKFGEIFFKINRTLHFYFEDEKFKRTGKVPEFKDLMKHSQDIIEEYSSMEQFYPVFFYFYQQCLNRILVHILSNYSEHLGDFMKLLIESHYADLTMKHVKEESLLDVKSATFSLPLLRDMLTILCNGCIHSTEFASRLVHCDIVKILTDFLAENINVENSHWKYIIKCIFIIFYQSARRNELSSHFKGSNIKSVLSSNASHDSNTQVAANVLLRLIRDDHEGESSRNEDSEMILFNFLKEDACSNIIIVKGFSFSALLQEFSNHVKHYHPKAELLPLLEMFKMTIANPERKEQIVLEFEKKLNFISGIENITIQFNINKIFWRSGGSVGILPKKPEMFVNDDFPKEFFVGKETIGLGAFGRVYIVHDMCRPFEKKFVAKRIMLNDNENVDFFEREARILLKLNHKRIVKCFGFQRNENDIFIFLEYLKNGSLASFIIMNGNLDEKLTRHFTIQILEAVNYLHQNNIIHQDIKSSNILMEDEKNIKLIDFGTAAIIDGNGTQTERGTVRYMAPEMIYTEGGKIINYISRADIWSVGCTVIEMLTGKPPNSSVPTPVAIFRIAMGEKLQYQLPPTSSVYLQEFLDKVLHRESKQRPTADWLLKYDAFIIGDGGGEDEI